MSRFLCPILPQLLTQVSHSPPLSVTRASLRTHLPFVSRSALLLRQFTRLMLQQLWSWNMSLVGTFWTTSQERSDCVSIVRDSHRSPYSHRLESSRGTIPTSRSRCMSWYCRQSHSSMPLRYSAQRSDYSIHIPEASHTGISSLR